MSCIHVYVNYNRRVRNTYWAILLFFRFETWIFNFKSWFLHHGYLQRADSFTVWAGSAVSLWKLLMMLLSLEEVSSILQNITITITVLATIHWLHERTGSLSLKIWYWLYTSFVSNGLLKKNQRSSAGCRQNAVEPLRKDHHHLFLLCLFK